MMAALIISDHINEIKHNGRNTYEKTYPNSITVFFIENTLVYVPQTDSSNKAEIEKFLNEMKY